MISSKAKKQSFLENIWTIFGLYLDDLWLLRSEGIPADFTNRYTLLYFFRALCIVSQKSHKEVRIVLAVLCGIFPLTKG